VASVVLVVGFLAVERRAAEPIIPLPLLRNRTFATTSAIGFVVGFAMFGAITFLPLYMQVVKGLSPTISGLRLTPLMAGLLVTSVGVGLQIISRWGRYKVFPVVGTAFMSVGLFLLSRIGVTTGARGLSAGHGGPRPRHRDGPPGSRHRRPERRRLQGPGVATAGTTFFRSIGASFGVAIFGAIFSNTLSGTSAGPSGTSGSRPGCRHRGVSPAQLKALPPVVRHVLVTGYADSLQTVFLAAVPVALLAFALTWFLPEVPLRRTTHVPDPADTLAPTAIPHTASSRDEIARALSVLARRENREEIYRWLATEAALDLSPAACWLLLRIDGHEDRPRPSWPTISTSPAPAVARLARSWPGAWSSGGGPGGSSIA
jgi:hypothetical protein